MNPTTNEAQERILSKIRKLMTFSKDRAASEGEVENALKLARRMMDEYNISEDSILVESVDAQEQALKEMTKEEIYKRAGAVDPYDGWLATVACNICGTKWYNMRNAEEWIQLRNGAAGYRRYHKIFFYGMRRDVAAAKVLFFELMTTMRAMARFHYGSKYGTQHADYMKGFANRLIQRTTDMSKQSQAETGSTAIVLVKDGLVKRWADQNLSLRAGRASSVRISNVDAHSRGAADANNVSLGTNQIGNSGRSGGSQKQLGS